MIPEEPNTSRYRFRGHKSLDGAFLGSAEMFEVLSGAHFVSPTPQSEGRTGAVEDSKRGQTRVLFDPNDYASHPSLPPDSEMLFLRVEDFDIAAQAYLPPGPILLVPTVYQFGFQDSTITIYGTAPGVSAVPGDKPPATSLIFALPLFTTSVTIVNLDGVNSLLVSTNRGTPMVPIPADGVINIDTGSISEMAVASENGNEVTFSMFLTMTKL
jgi:hypothetical protein